MTSRETRAVPVGGLRVEGRDLKAGGRLITGYAACFNSLTTIAEQIREQIAPGAFKLALVEDDVRALIDHNPSLLLGRNRAGTLRLAEDTHGLRFEIDPPDTQAARDLLVSIERGDVSGCSFGFRAVKEAWDYRAKPLPIRTIQQCRLFDVSIVTYPAYPDTEVALRSLEQARRASNFDAAKLRLRLQNDLRLRELELTSKAARR